VATADEAGGLVLIDDGFTAITDRHKTLCALAALRTIGFVAGIDDVLNNLGLQLGLLLLVVLATLLLFGRVTRDFALAAELHFRRRHLLRP
jgi:hypothetical protein